MFTEFEHTNLRLAAQLGVFKTFAVGKEKLREAEINHLLHFLDPSFQRPGCLTNNDVTYLQSKASQVLPKTVETEPYQEWCSDHPAEVGSAAPGYAVCQNCCRTIEESIKQGREKIWQLLPTFFGLPSWEILTADDDESGINSEE